MGRRVFISYSRKQEAEVGLVVRDLEKLGYSPWIDKETKGGQEWWDTILDAIEECDIFIYALSEDALNSTACLREHAYAKSLHRSILPIAVVAPKPHLPSSIATTQYVDYGARTSDSTIELLNALERLPSAPTLHRPLPVSNRPPIPLSYLANAYEEILKAPSLSIAQQSEFVLGIKAAWLKGESSNDVRSVLTGLRKRPDLVAHLAEEVDELLAKLDGGDKRRPEPYPQAEPHAPSIQEPETTAVGTTVFTGLLLLFSFAIAAVSCYARLR